MKRRTDKRLNVLVREMRKTLKKMKKGREKCSRKGKPKGKRALLDAPGNVGTEQKKGRYNSLGRVRMVPAAKKKKPGFGTRKTQKGWWCHGQVSQQVKS